MTDTTDSRFNFNTILTAIGNLSADAMRDLYRTASAVLVTCTGDTQAELNDDAEWFATDIKTNTGWDVVQNATTAALMTMSLVSDVQGALIKDATTLQVTDETLAWSQMGGHLNVPGTAGDAWLLANLSGLVA